MSRRIPALLLALLATGLAASCASTAVEPGGSLGDAGAGFLGAAGEGGVDCQLGAERCDCRSDGSCDSFLVCLSNLCVDAHDLCPYANDGFCDEPDFCPTDTDVADCCAQPMDGNCEEESMGGSCPDGTDAFDCGICPAVWVNDGRCDEPDFCPAGTDGSDCCAQPMDGECEEIGKGGQCPEGSDAFDCGYCPTAWVGDGQCDEPNLCPKGTDVADCCAHPADGVCDEVGMGGECPDGSDWYDCGQCPPVWLGDGLCDERQVGGPCPSNSDPEDCCATWGDEVCEEPSADGDCPELSDYLDCGYCPEFWVNDGFCDDARVGGTCPEGSDGNDCCATFRDDVCEEEAMGGECPDGSDWYDCGYCPDVWIADGYCDETVQPWACPAGTDDADCAD